MQTKWSVRAADTASGVLITVGGVGTILAVLLVFVFLLWVVYPLFLGASAGLQGSLEVPWKQQPLHVAIDEYRTMGYAVYPDGSLHLFELSTGDELDVQQLAEDKTITAFAANTGKNEVAIGYSDGTVQVGKIEFGTTFREKRDIDKSYWEMNAGDMRPFESGMVERTPQGQFRIQKVSATLQKPQDFAEAAIRSISLTVPSSEGAGIRGQKFFVAAVADDATVHFVEWSLKKFMGRARLSGDPVEVPFDTHNDKLPLEIFLTPRVNDLFMVWEDGRLRRYDIRAPQRAKLVEELDILEQDDRTITMARHLLGRETLIFGDSQGGLKAWLRVRAHAEAENPGTEQNGLASEASPGELVASPDLAAPDDQATPEGDDTGNGVANDITTVLVHALPDHPSAVTALGISERSRMLAVGYEDGLTRLLHVTTENRVLDLNPDNTKISKVVITPKDDGLLISTAEKIYRFDFEPGHPEATFASLFMPVHYEGYSKPIHRWQSSFAGVESEMKLGMIPLIFGTLKATFYSMIFGAPLALLAAIYTSEFVDPRVRTNIKPTIELMASLPSVVLGFLAALVFAPIVETFVPAVLASLATIPLTFILGSYLWQLQPRRLELLMNRLGLRLVFVFIALGVGVSAAYFSGPLVEQWLFAGNIMRWLNGQIGNGVGGWLILLAPAITVAVAFFVSTYIHPIMRDAAGSLSRLQFGLLNLLKFVVAAGITAVVTYLIAMGLDAAGFDPRGPWFSPLGTYVQRNALVVGFVMGFAIIPIIYTIAEDALSTVPRHLRSASLGAGATPWQTAVRIVIPTAMSGLFSALMIGLGRAVGETMIVLMAAGNTPVMDMNVFSGFRTLSANIAVELPEAVRDSTHYRTLFLAALVLFILTFIVNTVAEIVRLRFRRRAYQL